MGRTCDQGYHVYVLIWNSAMNIPNKISQDNNQKCCPSIRWGLNNKSNDKLAGARAVGVKGEHLLSLYINELTLSWREGIKTVVITLQVITLFVKPIQSLIVWPTCYSLCHTILCIPQRQFDVLGEVFVLQDAFCNRITGRRVGRDRVTVYTCQTTLPPLCSMSRPRFVADYPNIWRSPGLVTSLIVADREGKITSWDLNPSMMFLPLGHWAYSRAAHIHNGIMQRSWLNSN